MSVKKIACIGAGYVGGPTMVKIAQKCPEITVTVVDINEERIDAWNSELLPVFEPGLKKIVEEVRGVNLFFSTQVEKAIFEADMIFVAVQTPTKTYGLGKGEASDLQYWMRTAEKIKKIAKSPKIIVEKSTVPLGTADAMRKILNSNSEIQHSVLSNPEFLAEGTAMEDLENPDRILIGSLDEEFEMAEELAEIYAHWIPREKILFSNIWSAEISKLTANAFLAQRISSINSIAALCERSGADIRQVANAIGMDSRIGSKFLKAGPGFGGSCFKKDILNLVYILRSNGLEREAEYWKQVVELNEWQTDRIVRRVLQELSGTIAKKKIAVLGYSFKADTGDTRETPSLPLCRKLLEEGAQVSVADPKSGFQAANDCNVFGGQFLTDAIEDAEAIILMTDWKEFKNARWDLLAKRACPGCAIFDYRNCLDHDHLLDLGFRVFPVGAKEVEEPLPF